MKKLLMLTIASSFISSAAMAGLHTEVSQASDKETAFKAGYALENGLSFEGEYIYNYTDKTAKEGTIGAAWKLSLTDNFWLEPQVAMTMPAHRHEQLAGFKSTYGNTYKAGLKAGFDFDFGLYTAARYRYEHEENKLEELGTKNKVTNKNGTHRTDLTVGYQFDMVDISANWIHKSTDVKANAQGGISGSRDARLNLNDYEFKVAYSKYKDVTPYLQYTVKDDMRNNQVSDKIKRDNVLKVGVSASF